MIITGMFYFSPVSLGSGKVTQFHFCRALNCHSVFPHFLSIFLCSSSVMQRWHQNYRTYGWIIPLTHRCGAKTSAGTFCGCDLVNWLIEVGLASDRGEAVIYGDRLVQGGVIQHITNEYEFRDEYLFYRFLQKSPEQSPPPVTVSNPQQEGYKETGHSSPSSLSPKT